MGQIKKKMFLTITRRNGWGQPSSFTIQLQESRILARSIPKGTINAEKRCEGHNPQINEMHCVLHRILAGGGEEEGSPK